MAKPEFASTGVGAQWLGTGRDPALLDGGAVPQEEPQHFARRVGPGWIGVAPGRVAAGPGVTGSLDHPVLAAGLAVPGAMRGHAVVAATGRAALAHDLFQPRVGGQRPGNHEPAIPGMHHGVGVPVKDDRRHRDGWPVARRALLHGKKPRRRIVRGSRRQPGMHARRREEIGIGRGGDDCRGAAGGQPRNVDARRVSRMIAQDRADYACNQRWLARAPDLIAALEPVPALVGVRGHRLRWIGHQQAELLGQGVHPRPCREIIRCLPTAVQHHDERHRGAGLRPDPGRCWSVELVAALALIARVAGKLERCAARNGRLMRVAGGRAGIPPASIQAMVSARPLRGFPTALGLRTLGFGGSALTDLTAASRFLRGFVRVLPAPGAPWLLRAHLRKRRALRPWSSRA